MDFPLHSETIGAVSKALGAAQAEFQPLKKTASNPYFRSKYAPQDAVLEATRPALLKHGLTVTQSPWPIGDRLYLISTLVHGESGEFLRCIYPIMPVEKRDKNTGEIYPPTPQDYGSATTYAVRYSYQALVGIAAEEDDDGNQASKDAAPKEANITPEQIARIKKLLTDSGADLEAFKRHFKIKELGDIRASWYDTVIAQIQKKLDAQA